MTRPFAAQAGALFDKRLWVPQYDALAWDIPEADKIYHPASTGGFGAASSFQLD